MSWLERVREKGLELHKAPEAEKTAEVCLTACTQNGAALKYVPEALKTAELCLAAVQAGGSLVDVPKALLTADFYLEAVKHNGRSLKYVPPELKTPEICAAAVKERVQALEFVPEAMRGDEVWAAAVMHNGSLFAQVPEKFRNREVWLWALVHGVVETGKLPDSFNTEDFWIAYAKHFKKVLHYHFERERFTPKLITKLKDFIPPEMWTLPVLLEVVRANGADNYAMNLIPNEAKTPELCLEAVKIFAGNLVYVPEALVTEEMCQLVADYQPSHLEWFGWIPDQIKHIVKTKRRNQTAD
jgi:hypothetical protein